MATFQACHRCAGSPRRRPLRSSSSLCVERLVAEKTERENSDSSLRTQGASVLVAKNRSSVSTLLNVPWLKSPAIEAGVLDPDEIREEEGFNPRGAAAPAVNEPEAGTRGVNVNITLPERMEHEFRHVDSETAQETRALARALSESTRELAQAQAKPAAPPVVNVNLPARRSVSEIERDLAGDIKRVTQLEHDV